MLSRPPSHLHQCRYDHKHPHRAPRAAPKPAATSGTAPSPEPGAPGLGSEPPASHALLASLPLDPFETDAGQGAEPGAAAVVDDDAMDGLGGWEEEGRDPWAQAAADAALRAGARPPPWSRPGAMAGAMTGAVARPPGAPASAHGLCPAFLATGTCPRGDACDRPHGEACPRCGRHALHPTDAAAAAAHLRECGARHDRLAARQAAARLECAICLERVLGKAEAGARRFGLLACDHVFCLACIRSWRQEGEVDVDTVRGGRGVLRHAGRWGRRRESGVGGMLELARAWRRGAGTAARACQEWRSAAGPGDTPPRPPYRRCGPARCAGRQPSS